MRVDHLEVAPGVFLVELALQEQARIPEDAGERRPQLVRDDAHELRLHPFALAQLLVLRLELALAVLERTGHRVERLGQLVQLRGSLLGQACREVARGDATRAGGDEPHRAHDAVREEDGEHKQE